jgi:hypothetical protein
MKRQHFLIVATISILLPSVDVMVSASRFSSWWENHGFPSLRGSGNITNTTETDPEQVLPSEPPEQATLPPCTTPADYCIMDIYVCPDGSYVARDPQLCCDFKPCPDDNTNDNTTYIPLIDEVLATLVGEPDEDTQAP